jgi:hypothetical protein
MPTDDMPLKTRSTRRPFLSRGRRLWHQIYRESGCQTPPQCPAGAVRSKKWLDWITLHWTHPELGLRWQKD